MTSLKDTLVSFTTYNNLPHIHDVSDVPKNHSRDLEDLRALLVKHNVPSGVCVRLIHKHYDVEDGEVMGFQEVTVPPYGNVTAMHPLKSPDPSKLHGIHYFVDKDGLLQAYEYAATEGSDMSNYESFLVEFCRIVVGRSLQMKYGLKLQCDIDETSRTEFELPSKRSTIMIPEGMPTPDGEYDVEVVTEWSSKPNVGKKGCSHCWHNVKSCSHKSLNGNFGSPEEVDIYLGAQKVEPGTPVWSIVTAVTEVC
jgi:hypothetical protein